MAKKTGRFQAMAKKIASKEDLQKYLQAVGAELDKLTAKKSGGWFDWDEDDDSDDDDESDDPEGE